MGVVTGNVTFYPESKMIVEFAGEQPGTEFDFLEVGGTVTLNGKLTLKLIDDFVPVDDATFMFIEADNVAGNFAEIDQTEMGRMRRFSIETDASGVIARAQTISISSYSEWSGIFFTPVQLADPSVSGPEADPEGDGLNNLMEYVTGGNPLGWDRNPLRYEEGILSLRWARGVDDWTWGLETSTNMRSWQGLEAVPSILESGVDSDWIQLILSEEVASSPGRYFNFKVVPSEP